MKQVPYPHLLLLGRNVTLFFNFFNVTTNLKRSSQRGLFYHTILSCIMVRFLLKTVIIQIIRTIKRNKEVPILPLLTRRFTKALEPPPTFRQTECGNRINFPHENNLKQKLSLLRRFSNSLDDPVEQKV